MREIPPTAGLPLRWSDFLPAGSSLSAGLSAYLQVPEVQIECSGTVALVVALSALKKRSARQQVIIPAYTCPLVPIAVVHCGLQPVLCDLSEDGFDFCPQTLASLCNENTLAVVPTHLGGRVAQMAPVLAAANRVGAYVIEDAAQSLGAIYQGQPLGLAGDIGFYSLAVGKGLTMFEGGILVAKDADLRRELRAASAGMIAGSFVWEARRLLELFGYAAFYNPRGLHHVYGKPLRREIQRGRLVEAVGDDFDFAIPLHRPGIYRQSIAANALARLPEFLRQTRQLAEQRRAVLAAIPGVRVLDDASDGQGVWPFLMVKMASPELRDAALERLWGSGLGVSRLFIHALPDYDYLRHLFPEAQVPNARNLAATMLTLSNSPWLDDAAFTSVADGLVR